MAFTIGKSIGKKDTDTKHINKYSFVKNIIEWAGFQVSGTITFKSANLANSGDFWSSIEKVFAEKTAVVTVPYAPAPG